MKLFEIKEIKGTITLLSGLHIGAGDMAMQIGGTDNPVIKHPHTFEPYIPGSSLKGKIRSLIEMRSGLMGKTDGKPISARLLRELEGEQKKECERILKLFGSSGADADDIAGIGPTRVSFSDCPLTPRWREKARKERLGLFEVKSENRIDRIRGVAEHPRFTERVPADTEFEFAMAIKILGPGEQDLLEMLMEGMKLLEMDALGGNGSRGYGRIRFHLDDSDLNEKFSTLNPFGHGG